MASFAKEKRCCCKLCIDARLGLREVAVEACGLKVGVKKEKFKSSFKSFLLTRQIYCHCVRLTD